MKKLFLAAAMVLLSAALCRAEKIYYKDARVLEAQILYLKGNMVWVRLPVGSVGINLQEIDKIENSDGTISQYDYRSLFNKSREYVEKKKYKEAIEVYNRLFAYLPESTQLRYLRGALYHKIGNLDAAINDYNFIVLHHAQNAQLLNNMGVIYAKKKNFTEALSYFEQALARDPWMKEAHNNLAELFLEMKEYRRAIKEYNIVIDIDANNASALYNLGIAYMNKGDWAKAKNAWEKVLAIDPLDSNAKKGLEYLKQKLDKPDKAS